MHVMIFGADGYMGSAFRTVYPDAAAPKVDIADARALAAVLDRERPDVVINAAGRTGVVNVDWCEGHRLETVHSNFTGPLVLLDQCARRSIYWVHIGTGCVYEGDNHGEGYSEADPPNFDGSFYARTKGWIDQLLMEFPVLVLRPRLPFDDSDHPRNLINKLARYSRVLDAKNSLTCLRDFLQAAQHLIARRRTGVYNIVNPGIMSPAEVMQRYCQIVAPAHSFERIGMNELLQLTLAGRSNCVLNIAKLRSEGLELPSVQAAVDVMLHSMAARRLGTTFEEGR